MQPQQLELTFEYGRRIDHERRLVNLVQQVVQKYTRFMRRVRVVEFRERAVQERVTNRQTGSRVVRMAIFPIRSDNNLRPVTADGASDLAARFGYVGKPAIRHAEIFAGDCSEERGGSNGFLIADSRRAARAHFAAGQIDNRERDAALSQQETETAEAPFHIIGMSAEQQDINGGAHWRLIRNVPVDSKNARSICSASAGSCASTRALPISCSHRSRAVWSTEKGAWRARRRGCPLSSM